MTCEAARERLNDQIDVQIDGTLDPVQARDLERHLEMCASCRGFQADLAAIADASASLEVIDAPDHLWLQIAGAWRREHGDAPAARAAARAPRTYAFSAFQMLAAAAVLAVAAGGGWIAWQAGSGPIEPERRVAGEVLLPRAVPASNVSADTLVESAKNDLDAAEELYTRAIAGLEQAALEQKDTLSPEVAKVIETNIGVLDQAIGQSRAAVQAQPASVEARESLFEALRKKVALLQNTITLVSEISRGNSAGASRLPGT
jgi:hypothetical protein